MNPILVERTEDDGVMKFTLKNIDTSFANAIRREWAWRVSRGESLANLEFARHFI